MGAIFSVPITKAGQNIDVDIDTVPEEQYKMILAEGLKVMLNKKMSKAQSLKNLEGNELESAKANALAIAQRNLEDIQNNRTTRGRTAMKSADGTKIPNVVIVEARRLAKEVVKNTLRAAKIKISHVKASEITTMANELMKADPTYLEDAQKAIEARSQIKAAIDVASLVHVSPELVAKANERKTSRDKTLSAKQAGMTTKVAPPRQKPWSAAH